MRISRRSCLPAERSKSRIKQRKSRWGIALTILNTLFLLLSTLCWAGTYSRNKALNEYSNGYTYDEKEQIVCLELEHGRKVDMQFGESSVKIKDANRISTLKEQTHIILFIKYYLKLQGQVSIRSNTEYLGEYRLHCKLYKLGYQKERTKDVDLEYGKDPRLYVNVFSRVLGWMGI